MDKYEEIKCIGRGSYGTAHLVTLRGSNEKYVVKKIPTELLTEKEKAQSFREVELLAKLNHPNVVEYRENFVEKDVIHIVMAYCDGGDLAEKIRERVNLLEKTPVGDDESRQRTYFDIGQILDWFVQMAMAIKYLHQQRILHRDLKTSNIFLTTENVIKLGDFGIAKTLDSTLDQAKTVVGTPYYMSPEVCENKPYSYSSDVWSLGCVLYEMCALKHAFDAPNIISLIFTIVRKECTPLPGHFDSEISGLLKKLLDKSPENRPSMDQIFMIPYIRNHMEGLVASGGSLRVNSMVRRPLGGLPKRRVHAKNMTMRRSSIESIKRKPRPTTSTSESSSSSQRTAAQWVPITPLDSDEYYLNQTERENDLELLDASILEESQLDLRAPERSRTPESGVRLRRPEPLVYFAEETKPQGAVNLPERQQLRGYNKQVTAWGNEPSPSTDQSYEAEQEYDGEDGVEEDIDSRFQAEAEELMNPNFENEYSEECMDSLQIYYSSKSSKAKSSRRENARFRAQKQGSECRKSPASSPFRPIRAFQADDECHGGDELEGEQMHRVLAPKRLFPLHANGDSTATIVEPNSSSSVDAYEQWGRHAAHDDATLLQLEEVSFDAEAMDNIEMRESGVSLSDSGILRVLEEEADSSCDDDDDDSSDNGDDSGDEGNDYTSLSEYEAEENYYSDDSDFYEENDTQYSDDFEDGDAEVIEYANDEFFPDDSFDDDYQVSLVLPSAGAAAGGGAANGSARPALSLSPTSKKQQKPPTEVQWVMRNVAQSLLESHDDLTVA